MNRSFLNRLLALLLIIAVPSLATVAVAHAHPGASSPHDSHCGLCLMAHSGTHALAILHGSPESGSRKEWPITSPERHPGCLPAVAPQTRPTQGNVTARQFLEC
jgi:hypothetical protein